MEHQKLSKNKIRNSIVAIRDLRRLQLTEKPFFNSYEKTTDYRLRLGYWNAGFISDDGHILHQMYLGRGAPAHSFLAGALYLDQTDSICYSLINRESQERSN